MIHEVRLRDFKAFQQQTVKLRPLNIFVGENNSGKSSILASIRLLAQTVQGRDPTVPLAFDGIFGDFGAYADLVHGHHRGRRFGIGMDFGPISPASRPERVRLDTDFKYRTQRRETILLNSTLATGSHPTISVGRRAKGENILPSTIDGWTIPDAIKSQLRRNLRMLNFVPRVILGPNEDSDSTLVSEARERLHQARPQAVRAADTVLRNLSRVDYLGAMRKSPERTYVNTGVVGDSIGQDGSNWPAFLALERSQKSSGLNYVREWVRSAGLADTIQVSWLSDRHYEIRITHPVSGENANIADVGQGTSQVMPVIVGGSRLGPGDIFLVEEPEIHLHPRAQASLGDFFVSLTSEGVQSLVETHSEYLIMRIQQHIAMGALDPEDVYFYYVAPTAKGKTVTRLELDATASFTEPIPGGFFPQRVEEAQLLAKARARQGRLWE